MLSEGKGQTLSKLQSCKVITICDHLQSLLGVRPTCRAHSKELSCCKCRSVKSESVSSPRYLTVKESIFPPLDPIAVSLIVFVPALRETNEEAMLQLVQVPVDGKPRLPFTIV